MITAMQRIVFVNLHSNGMIMLTMSSYLFKFSSAIKHGYLLQYLLNHPEKFEVCNFINDRGFSSLTCGPEFLLKFLNIFSGFENQLTLKKNKLHNKPIKVIHHKDEIKPEDIVILYNCFRSNYRHMSDINAFKVLSMIHFHGFADESKIISNAGVRCLMGETDLSKTSELYNRYYKLNLPWIIHPFVPAERFKNMKDFQLRKNKCFSTGTITYKKHSEFLSVYKDSCDQPSRKFVLDNQVYFKETVDCFNSNYEEPGDKKVIIKDNDFDIIKLYKKIYNRFHLGQQKQYFSFNMVEKFNEYKMHFVGEEILGVPGIGFVEGMACGSAYIGLDSPMYRDYGLIPGVHYITYDGTKEGLKSTVEYWQRPENQEKLEQIASAGCEFVRKNFNGEVVAQQLLERIINMAKA